MPKVAGIIIETTFGSIVEIILFVVLIVKHKSGSADDNGTPSRDLLDDIEDCANSILQEMKEISFPSSRPRVSHSNSPSLARSAC